MLIPLIEPSHFRYIHINPVTNHIHLLVPFIAGLDVSTDNTCKSFLELNAFFGGGAFNELESYKNTLEFHLSLLEEGNAQYHSKKDRLDQINRYIKAVVDMGNSYMGIVNGFLRKPSNLYSIQLRPPGQDHYSRVVNPVFTINRRNDSRGRPLSPLYKRMHEVFADVVIGAMDPKSRLTQAVLVKALPPTFQVIQQVLHEQCQALFGIDVDFNHYFKHEKGGNGKVKKLSVTQASVDAESGFLGDTSPEEYIDGLLYLCAPNLWIDIPTSHFYKIANIAEDLPATQKREAISGRTERLSMLTQFFLANVNIYCRAKNISTANFGVILDNSYDLSDKLTAIVFASLSTGVDVEERISQFFNAHGTEFGLTRALTSEDIMAIKQKFASTYQTVTATNENPHMDDFMFLDTEAHGKNDIFISSRGLICTDFANIAPNTGQNQDYFATIRQEARMHRDIVTPQDEPVITIDIEPVALINKLDDVQWERLPKEVVDTFRALPAFKVRKLLDYVAKGKQKEADAMLKSSDDIQTLLRTPGKFTDYSGRTFNCTAYEYAYWAKDTHMQRMLEHHMDDETKAFLLERVDKIEHSGLAYQQHGKSYQNAHYDMSFVLKNLNTEEFRQLQTMVGQGHAKLHQATVDNYQTISFTATEYETLKKIVEQHRPTGIFDFFGTSPAKTLSKKLQFDFHSLITALDTFVTHFDRWNYHQQEAAWMKVGMAQRDVPAHWAHEYCRQDRAFYPRPEFNEATLPRAFRFSNIISGWGSWFPLESSKSGLGFDFALMRVERGHCRARGGSPRWDARPRPLSAKHDLVAIMRLDEVRTVDLTQSREHLNPPAVSQGMSI